MTFVDGPTQLLSCLIDDVTSQEDKKKNKERKHCRGRIYSEPIKVGSSRTNDLATSNGIVAPCSCGWRENINKACNHTRPAPYQICLKIGNFSIESKGNARNFNRRSGRAIVYQ